MEKTITYLGIESVHYIFSEEDILLALMEKFRIKDSYNYEFNLCEGYEDQKPYAELVIKYPRKASGE